MHSPLQESSGFRLGQRVNVMVEAKGADHEDIEHVIAPGATGIIEGIERMTNDQGLAFTVWIPINELEGRGIVNVFDELDGPITNFLSAKETP